MGQKEHARAVVIRTKILDAKTRQSLQAIAGNARSLVESQDHSRFSGMCEAVSRAGIELPSAVRGDMDVLYEMSQGRYGGLLDSQERPRTHVPYRQNPNKVAQEQREYFLKQTGTREEDWGSEGFDAYLNP